MSVIAMRSPSNTGLIATHFVLATTAEQGNSEAETSSLTGELASQLHHWVSAAGLRSASRQANSVFDNDLSDEIQEVSLVSFVTSAAQIECQPHAHAKISLVCCTPAGEVFRAGDA